MKRFWVLAFILFVSLVCGAAPCLAADVTAAVDLNSAYVWRGMTFNDGLVLQPSLDVEKGGLGINVWGNLDISDYDDTLDSGEFSEIDLTLSYDLNLGGIDVSMGYIEYLFPTTEDGGAEGTRELYVSLGMGLPAGLTGSFTTYYDFDEIEDYYLKLGLAYSQGLTDKMNLGAGISLAYAGDEYCADGEAGLYDYNLSLSLGYAVSEALSVTASLNYTDSLDDDNLAEVGEGGHQDVNLYGGVNLSYIF